MNRIWSAAALAAALLASSASARDLSWNELDVYATLDAQGVLHVSETHVMLFNGDWNGGERTFDVREGQKLQVERVTRIDDATHRRIELVRGSLATVDHWDFFGPTTIRWRSRYGHDPVFENTTLTYVIDYTIANVLAQSLDGSYRLDHDFAFPGRPGEIRRFRLNLGVDATWRVIKGAPVSITTGPLQPGEKYVVHAEMTGGALAKPSVMNIAASLTNLLWRLIMIATTAFIIGAWWLRFLSRERADGRFTPLQLDIINRVWLEQNSHILIPEVASALFHGKVSEDAVSATLAKLTDRGAIATSTSAGNVLHLQMRQPFEEFRGYERDLIQALFLGHTETDTIAIREYYASSGFRPANVIRAGVTEAVEKLLREPVPKRGLFGCLAGLAISVSLVCSLLLLGEDITSAARFTAMLSLGFIIVVALAHLSKAAAWRDDLQATERGSVDFMRPAIAGLIVTMLLAVFAPRNTVWQLVVGLTCGGTLFAAALCLSTARARGGPRRRLWQWRVRALQRYLSDELNRSGRLEEHYMPYAVAVGLGKTRSLAVAPPAPSPASTDDAIDHDRDSRTEPSYASGGGAFGGAGASGSWAMAAASLASGVSAPAPVSSSSDSDSSWSSDSGGSSGDSGGGDSSGGGGGGGW